MRLGHLSCAALVFFAPLSQAGLVDISWDGQQRFQQELRVEPGSFIELCGKLSRGAKVKWRFDAGAPMNFNIHYHEGKEVRFPVKEDGSLRSGGTLDVKSEQDYCWMWSNKGATPADLRVDLDKGG